MIEVSVMADVAYAIRELDAIERRHVPFATSRAINATGLDAQKAVRAGLADRFTLRRKAWADRTVKIKPFATKQTLTLRLFLDPVQGDRLTKFEDGGTKKPRGRGVIAVPVNQRTVQRGKDRPKAMLFRLHGKGPKGTVWVGRDRTVMIVAKDGKGRIFRRRGATAADRAPVRSLFARARRTGDSELQLLYKLTPRTKIRAQLRFVPTAREVVRDRFDRHFDREINRALASLTAPLGLMGR